MSHQVEQTRKDLEVLGQIIGAGALLTLPGWATALLVHAFSLPYLAKATPWETVAMFGSGLAAAAVTVFGLWVEDRLVNNSLGVEETPEETHREVDLAMAATLDEIANDIQAMEETPQVSRRLSAIRLEASFRA